MLTSVPRTRLLAKTPAWSVPDPFAVTAPEALMETAPPPAFSALMPWLLPVTAIARITRSPPPSFLARMPCSPPVTAAPASMVRLLPESLAPALEAWIPSPSVPVVVPATETVANPVPWFMAHMP